MSDKCAKDTKKCAQDSEDAKSGNGGAEEKSGSVVKPKNEIANNGCVKVSSGSSDTQYELKRKGKVYSCSCPAWRNQKHPIDRRTCKHLRQHLGEAFERQRCGATASARTAARKRKKPSPEVPDADENGPPRKKVRLAQAAAAAADDDGDEKGDEGEGGKAAVAVLLAKSYDEAKHDPVGWWISEKLDGVRAYWNGSKLLTRNGNQLYAPAWFLKPFPKDMSLDGELWLKRKAFNEIVSIVRTHSGADEEDNQESEWKAVKYMVFDAPSEKPFEERVKAIADLAKRCGAGHLVPVQQTLCTDRKQLEAMLDKVILDGGEGLMLRQPKSKYVGKRSDTLLKVKKMRDAEAKVVGYKKGKGKHAGTVGSLECQLPNGIKFFCGTGLDEKTRANPPKIGTTISFSFQETTPAGAPRFPAYRGPVIDR